MIPGAEEKAAHVAVITLITAVKLENVLMLGNFDRPRSKRVEWGTKTSGSAKQTACGRGRRCRSAKQTACWRGRRCSSAAK